ncbi:FMN adenylyltransferase / Riboflavin kinase [hydrothermal vent metagenome]|uniref:Bifunctional riboflavin kinase/FMN adenylyltransferase n=1 Tax=hydrothermal vent metagenome TaxID=652676 RepID=A0A3B0V967_9ZZZZ
MRFMRYPQYSPSKKPTVITIGNFDGIHIGHQALINKVTTYARINKLYSTVVTMQPSAVQYFRGNNTTTKLTAFRCKYQLLKELGVDIMCVLNFNSALAAYSPVEFIQRILIDGLNARHIIIGDDFKFGKNRAGDIHTLKDYCKPLGITITAITTVTRDNIRVSSSSVRHSLANSDFQAVEASLGRKFSITGKVSKGNQLGRTLGFPTINLKLGTQAVPINGVFCVTVRFNGGLEYFGAASIGTRPTIKNKANSRANILEVYILDFNKQIYGQNVEVLFHHKLRNEVEFDNLDELTRQINADVVQTRLFFDNKLTEPLREQ